MATGIIAIGASQQNLDWLAQILFAIAVVADVVLAALARCPPPPLSPAP